MDAAVQPARSATAVRNAPIRVLTRALTTMLITVLAATDLLPHAVDPAAAAPEQAPANLVVGVGAPPSGAGGDPGYLDETYRPQYHYTAEKNMINDPNGLVYLDGEYHLFHQYNLFDAVHWGHAVSRDLVHWTRLEPALFPDAIGQIWSGSVVVDAANTSGFQTGTTPVMVAAFTYGEHHKGPQSQGLAYSNDKGRTWTMDPGNPVIPNPGLPDFRDPKIFWHAPTHRWVMVLTVGKTLDFYTSPNLRSWTKRGSWGSTEPHPGNWECPDLFPIKVKGSTTTKWVLSVSQDRGAPSGGVGMRYFVGDFTGTTFVPDQPGAAPLWQNYGKDYYAGITFNNLPYARRVMIAWNDNWQHRFAPPTQPFNGQLSLPRELTLQSRAAGLRLIQTPVAELSELRGTPVQVPAGTIASGTHAVPGIKTDSAEILATFDVGASTATAFGLNVRVGAGQSTPVGYNRASQTMYVDRTRSGAIPNPTGVAPTPYWAGVHSAPLPTKAGKVTLRIFLDRSSVEVFGNDEQQISDLLLPDRTGTSLQIFASGGHAALDSLTIYPMARAFPTASPTRSSLTSWTTVSGEWADTRDGREGSADGLGLTLGNQTASDATVSARLRVEGVRPGNPEPIKDEAAVGLVVRADPLGQSGYVGLINAQADTVSLNRLDHGELTVLASSSTPITTNTDYDTTLTASGTALTLTSGGVTVRATDSARADGQAGLAVKDAAAFAQNISLRNATDFRTNLTGWTPASGTWRRTSSGLLGGSDGDGTIVSSRTATDFTYGSDLRITPRRSTSSGAGTLIFRADATATQGYGANLDAHDDVLTFFRWGPQPATLARLPIRVDDATTYRLEVQAVGDTFTFSVDGAVVGRASDTTYRDGHVGLDTYDADVSFTNTYLAEQPTGPTPLRGTWQATASGWTGRSTGDGFLGLSTAMIDGTIEADITVSGSQPGAAAAGLMLRSNAEATRGYLANLDAANDAVTLIRFDGGPTAILARYAYSIDPDRTYRLSLQAVGPDLRVYLDHRLVATASDRTYPSGRMALNTWNSTATITGVNVAEQQNLLSNGGFEQGDLTGWEEWHLQGQNAAVGVDTYDPAEGRYKAYFYADSPFQQSIHQRLTLPNGSYLASARVKLSGRAATARLELGDNGAPRDVPIPVAGYARLQAVVTVSTGRLSLGFYLDAPARTSLQIDQVSLTPL